PWQMERENEMIVISHRLFILRSIPRRLYGFVRRSTFTEAFASIEPVEVQSLSFHSLGISGK
uniref:hypothetical protein n=1 Tax=Dialister sp. TaxID=1955814 RepID=UPI0040299B71